MALKIFTRKNEIVEEAEPQPRRVYKPKPKGRPDAFELAPESNLSEDQLERQLQLERYAFIAINRELWGRYPEAEKIYRQAVLAIDADFALVPEGFGSLVQSGGRSGVVEQDVPTQPFLLARCCVTNTQFQKFVDAGVYQDLELWPRDIWPQLIDFKDQTGLPGPRYWREGRHHAKLAEHPVVGVCWYEAAAYAKWAGYRLPAEAEWQMAASWRLRTSAQIMRRYPWGDALDTRKCNIWGSCIGRTVRVEEYPGGSAPTAWCS